MIELRRISTPIPTDLLFFTFGSRFYWFWNCELSHFLLFNNFRYIYLLNNFRCELYLHKLLKTEQISKIFFHLLQFELQNTKIRQTISLVWFHSKIVIFFLNKIRSCQLSLEHFNALLTLKIPSFARYTSCLFTKSITTNFSLSMYAWIGRNAF